jgi:hypothetical protein
MRTKLIALLAFAGLFITALATGAANGLPGADMAAMGVLAMEPLPDRAVVGQTEANPGGGVAGEGGWGEALPITNNRLWNMTYFANGHKVVYGTNGVGHMVWTDYGGYGAIFYKRYYPKTGWTGDLKLSDNGSEPSIALDANGKDIHVVWGGYKPKGNANFHILYRKCVPGKSGTGGWRGSGPTDLCDNTPGHSYSYHAVASGPNGQVVVVWRASWLSGADAVQTYEFREYASGRWQTQEQIEDPIPSYRGRTSISTDGAGNVFVAYDGSMSLEPNARIDVYVNSRVGGIWQEWENVTLSVEYPDKFILPHLDVDPTGRPHIVCESQSIGVLETDPSVATTYYHIYHTYRGAGGWIVPEMISAPEPEAFYDRSPSMFFDASGTAHVIWVQTGPDYGIEYSFRNPSTGVWSTPSWVTSNNSYEYFSPHITVGPGGALYGVWTCRDAAAEFPYQIWGSSSSGSFGGQDAGTTATPRGLTLDVSPNPASRGMVVSYTLPVAGNASLKLYDVSGALAKTVACGYVLLPGRQAVSLSRQGLARGAYILKLESGASSVTRKLVIH